MGTGIFGDHSQPYILSQRLSMSLELAVSANPASQLSPRVSHLCIPQGKVTGRLPRSPHFV